MNLRKSITIALMGVLSFIIMFLEFPLPIFPEFLKIDLSDIPGIIVGFAFGPLSGVAVELVKNILHLMRTTTGGVGELANFIVGLCLSSSPGGADLQKAPDHAGHDHRLCPRHPQHGARRCHSQLLHSDSFLSELYAPRGHYRHGSRCQRPRLST